MWRWPSKTFWPVKSALFATFLLLFCAAAAVVFFGAGMRAFGPSRAEAVSPMERAVGWFVVTPMRPSETFPTDYLLINLLCAVGANAVVWSWVGSMGVAVAYYAAVSGIRRGRRGGVPRD